MFDKQIRNPKPGELNSCYIMSGSFELIGVKNETKTDGKTIEIKSVNSESIIRIAVNIGMD